MIKMLCLKDGGLQGSFERNMKEPPVTSAELVPVDHGEFACAVDAVEDAEGAENAKDAERFFCDIEKGLDKMGRILPMMILGESLLEEIKILARLRIRFVRYSGNMAIAVMRSLYEPEDTSACSCEIMGIPKIITGLLGQIAVMRTAHVGCRPDSIEALPEDAHGDVVAAKCVHQMMNIGLYDAALVMHRAVRTTLECSRPWNTLRYTKPFLDDFKLFAEPQHGELFESVAKEFEVNRDVVEIGGDRPNTWEVVSRIALFAYVTMCPIAKQK